MSLFDFFGREPRSAEPKGEPELKFGFRGEDITYRMAGKELNVSFTHMKGPRIHTETITKWKDGTLLSEEEKTTFFLKALPFIQRNFSDKAVVVINSDDPFSSFWERLCSEHRGLLARTEHTSDREQVQFQRNTFLQILKSGKGGLVINDTPITDEQTLDRVLEEFNSKRRR